MLISAACAVHCAVLPFIAGLLPLLGLYHFADEWFEWSMVGVTALIGAVGHLRAFLRHHRHAGPGLLFVVGLSLVVVTRLRHAEDVLEPIALGVGGVFAAAAHWMNLRLCQGCEGCAGVDAGL